MIARPDHHHGKLETASHATRLDLTQIFNVNPIAEG
jgi:hypothetical protein